MALTDDISLLSAVPIFEGFNEEMLRLIAFGSERKAIAKGRPLFHEGATADSAFVITSGKFKLMQRDGKGKPKQIAEAKTGDMLGEMALISASNRRMTAMALENCEVMRIHRPMFRRMMEEYPEIAVMLTDRLRDNLAMMLSQINTLAPQFDN